MSLANHALGPEIYDDTSDTSGVAIFLSHLYAVTRNDVFRQTAEGAIKHATSHVHDIDDFFRLGFYDGILGIGYASLKTAGFLDDDRILENAISIDEKVNKAKFWDGPESNPSWGFQPLPSVTETCYPVRLFRRTVPEPSLPIPVISDPSVSKCDTAASNASALS